MMSELKSCPFCGGKAVIKKVIKAEAIKKYPQYIEKLRSYPESWITMGCDTPGCILFYDTYNGTIKLGFYPDSEEEAAKAWNKRAPA